MLYECVIPGFPFAASETQHYREGQARGQASIAGILRWMLQSVHETPVAADPRNDSGAGAMSQVIMVLLRGVNPIAA